MINLANCLQDRKLPPADSCNTTGDLLGSRDDITLLKQMMEAAGLIDQNGTLIFTVLQDKNDSLGVFTVHMGLIFLEWKDANVGDNQVTLHHLLKMFSALKLCSILSSTSCRICRGCQQCTQ